ncbi:MAG: hypothetical protein BGO98_49345 [Myxococcales bacterium 68-20]|nr:hypothetical protein [Myxococcales bacterium]OJY29826.1 MAG: hypothetical protein BGO98_49345 [Myxococcales bacterium 68-20]
MVKKLFALASVTALTGLVSAVGVAGCSDSESETTPSTTDAGTDAKPPREAAPPPDEEEEPEPEGTCVTKNPIDATQFPYQKAEQVPGACTTEELKKLTDYFATKVSANEDVKVSEWKKEVAAKCASCIFSEESDTSWGPIIEKDDAFALVNQGGCIEIASGKEACGRAYQQTMTCWLEACLVDCKTQEEFDACRADQNSIWSGPCKDTFDNLQKECGSSISAYQNACKNNKWTFDAAFVRQCGGEATDAGK